MDRESPDSIQTEVPPLDLIVDRALENVVLLIPHLAERTKMKDLITTRNMVVCLNPSLVGANPQLAKGIPHAV